MNVLIVRAGALGDVLLLRGTVAVLRAAGHRVSLLAPASAGRALLGAGPAEVEAVLDWEAAATASLLAGPPLPPDLERALGAFEVIVAYTGDAGLATALGATGARVIVHPPRPPAGGPHAGAWGMGALARLGLSAETALPLLAPSPDEEAGARAWLHRLPDRFLALHPGSGSPAKNWPAERFAALVEAVCPEAPWLLVEGPADAEAARPLARHGRAVVARGLPVRVLGALLSRAGLYVGNDSGVSHLAAAFGAHVLALFGPTDPAQWSPVGPAVVCLRAADRTMAGLAAAEVEAAARSALSSPRPPSG